MKLMTRNSDGAAVQLTNDELYILNNALNEVCNGLGLPEFSTRMGAEREEAEALLAEIQNVLNTRET